MSEVQQENKLDESTYAEIKDAMAKQADLRRPVKVSDFPEETPASVRDDASTTAGSSSNLSSSGQSSAGASGKRRKKGGAAGEPDDPSKTVDPVKRGRQVLKTAIAKLENVSRCLQGKMDDEFPLLRSQCTAKYSDTVVSPLWNHFETQAGTLRDAVTMCRKLAADKKFKDLIYLCRSSSIYFLVRPTIGFATLGFLRASSDAPRRLM